MNGLPGIVASYLRTKYGTRFSSRDALLRWQDAQVRRFVTDVTRRSRFYARHLRGYTAAEWRSFPVIDKQIMMDNFDDLNTVGVTRAQAFEVALAAERSRDFSPTIGEVAVGLSSGTSGNRGLFLVTPRERALWAGAVLARLLPPLRSAQRIAFFLRANNNLYTSVRSRLIGFEYFDLLDPMERHVARLDELAPTIVVAPPSMLRLLAQARADGALRARPDKIVSVAEVLDPVDEKFISAQFGQIVHQVYQCTEGFLACTCAHGTLHLNEDFVAVQKEYLDRDLGKFVPIITDFRRAAQPIIRYRLNDILTERGEPCPCGSPFTALASVEGRCDDLFYFPAAGRDGWIHVFPDFIRRAVLETSEDVAEYLVRQVAADRLELTLQVAEGLRPDVEQRVAVALRQLVERQGGRAPDIAPVPAPARSRDKKLKRVERVFAAPVR